jgi:hypothetical protein
VTAAVRRALVTILVVALTAPLAWAQERDTDTWKPDAGHASSYDAVAKRYADLVMTWRYRTLFSALADDLEASRRWRTGDRVRDSLATALREMASRFVDVEAKLDTADDATKLQVINDALRSPKGLFLPVNEAWFSGRTFEVTEAQVEALSFEQFDDFMHRVNTAQRLLASMASPNRDATVAAIGAAAERWRQYVFDGRSQYPWEMALNGATSARGSDIQNPPRRQWILFHPEVGAEIGTGGTGAANLTAKESILIQALGHVWYRWPESSGGELGWWGISASASIREELRPGVGFTVHYGRVVNVGLLWRDLDRNGSIDRTPYFHTGIDLFRLAKKRLPGWVTERIEDGTRHANALPPSP